MDLIERATIMHFHRHRIAEYGDQVEALGWRSVESQQKRFAVIAERLDFNHTSVLDVGCGRGDLKAFLDARFVDVGYIGIDQMPEFVAAANARFQQEPCCFYEADFSTVAFPRVDLVVASGALGYRTRDADFVFEMVRRMFATAERAVVFNLLDASTFTAHPLLVGRDCAAVEEFCRTLSQHVEVVRGYLDDDVTFVVHRETEAAT